MQMLRSCVVFFWPFSLSLCMYCDCAYIYLLCTFCYFDRSIHIDDVKNKIVGQEHLLHWLADFLSLFPTKTIECVSPIRSYIWMCEIKRTTKYSCIQMRNTEKKI